MLRAALIIAAVGAVRCAGSPEDAVIRQFFAASRLRDLTVLSRFSVVTFEPHVHGTVAAFEILDESPPRRRPLQPSEAAAASLADPSLDLSAAAGEVVSKEVTLRAEVRLPVDGTADRILTVTLERALATSPRRIAGQWIVTAFREEAAR